MNQIQLMPEKKYNEAEIVHLIKDGNPHVSEARVKWILFDMQRSNQITRIGHRKYIVGNARAYNYAYQSGVAKDIVGVVDDLFPLVKIVVWELTQLNEWTHLLLSKNVIIVEVESGFESIVFDELMNFLGNSHTILLSPNEDIISRYMRDELIIVKRLFTRSPLKKGSRSIALEKLAIDVMADGYLSGLLGTEGMEYVVKGIMNNYAVNISKMFTYAKRRNVDKTLLYIWGNNYD